MVLEVLEVVLKVLEVFLEVSYIEITRSAQNHTSPPLALGTFNENPYAKTV